MLRWLCQYVMIECDISINTFSSCYILSNSFIYFIFFTLWREVRRRMSLPSLQIMFFLLISTLSLSLSLSLSLFFIIPLLLEPRVSQLSCNIQSPTSSPIQQVHRELRPTTTCSSQVFWEEPSTCAI